jgi:hypothetical protein
MNRIDISVGGVFVSLEFRQMKHEAIRSAWSMAKVLKPNEGDEMRVQSGFDSILVLRAIGDRWEKIVEQPMQDSPEVF